MFHFVDKLTIQTHTKNRITRNSMLFIHSIRPDKIRLHFSLQYIMSMPFHVTMPHILCIGATFWPEALLFTLCRFICSCSLHLIHGMLKCLPGQKAPMKSSPSTELPYNPFDSYTKCILSRPKLPMPTNYFRLSKC